VGPNSNDRSSIRYGDTIRLVPVKKRTGDDRIFTIPNVLSVIRLCCVPIFLWLLFGRNDRGAAAWLMGATSATDWVDGYIARRFDQGSTLGKIIDPVADRALLGFGIGGIAIDGAAPLWLCLLVVVREVLVSLAVVAMAALGGKRIDVQYVGKAATMGLMIAFPFFLFSRSGTSIDHVWRVVAWGFAIPGVILSYYSGATYIPLGLAALRDGRAARRGRST
jgi:cardiolipin synthase (CMP-forming)